MNPLDPPPNDAQIARDLAEFEANPVTALFAFAEYFDEEGSPLRPVHPHIMKFIVQRLKAFTEGRPPQGLQQVFKANKRNRNRAHNARVREKIRYEITFERILGSTPSAQELAEKHGISESIAKAQIALVIQEERAESSRKVASVSDVKGD